MFCVFFIYYECCEKIGFPTSGAHLPEPGIPFHFLFV